MQSWSKVSFQRLKLRFFCDLVQTGKLSAEIQIQEGTALTWT